MEPDPNDPITKLFFFDFVMFMSMSKPDIVSHFKPKMLSKHKLGSIHIMIRYRIPILTTLIVTLIVTVCEKIEEWAPSEQGKL